MVRSKKAEATYHVLLIGIDDYGGVNTLNGCVNDIDDIENLLLDGAGVGDPTLDIRITRLAAPNPGSASTTKQATTISPTRDHIVAALERLAAPRTVRSRDRVLIYYSGHGFQSQWSNTMAWHEAIVPVDLQLLYDIELNALINDISRRTDDLTMILDSCNSAGATKEARPDDARTRVFRDPRVGVGPVAPPATLVSGAQPDSSPRGTRILQSVDPRYLVLAACMADESAIERPFDGRHNGVLTHTFVSLLKGRDEVDRSHLRWTDIRSRLLLGTTGDGDQHPWFTGRLERRVFGGKYTFGDAGYPVSKQAAGTYRIEAGTLMSITAGATFGIYGKDPPLFPEVGSDDDHHYRLGTVAVTHSEKSSSLAASQNGEIAWPDEGARARLLKAGVAERLRVAVEHFDADMRGAFDNDFNVVPWNAPASDVEVRVSGSAQEGWTISNDAEDNIAQVRPGQVHGLVAGLHAYALYNNVLRMALKRCNDPELAGRLSVSVLDCTPVEGPVIPTVHHVDALIDKLHEAPKIVGAQRYDGAYHLSTGAPFAFKVANSYKGGTLYVTLLNCTAGGKVECLGDESIQPGDRKMIWHRGNTGESFKASPSMGRESALDRAVVLATTRPGIDLRYLQQPDNIQKIVDNETGTRDMDEDRSGEELWTAVVTPVLMGS